MIESKQNGKALNFSLSVPLSLSLSLSLSLCPLAINRNFPHTHTHITVSDTALQIKLIHKVFVLENSSKLFSVFLTSVLRIKERSLSSNPDFLLGFTIDR